jgi:hypothetical protein
MNSTSAALTIIQALSADCFASAAACSTAASLSTLISGATHMAAAGTMLAGARAKSIAGVQQNKESRIANRRIRCLYMDSQPSCDTAGSVPSSSLPVLRRSSL